MPDTDVPLQLGQKKLQMSGGPHSGGGETEGNEW